MPPLDLRAVTLRRPGFVLGPVDLRVPGDRPPAETGPASLTVLVGPSGSGKSTLLALAAGLMPPSTGDVRHGGVSLASLRDAERARLRRRTVSFAAQQPLFFADLTVAENLARAAARRGVTNGLERARHALDRVGLADLADRPPVYLSGGEQARANVARALLCPAATVLLDEPTAMLDTATAARIRERLIEESRVRPLVVATHDEELVGAGSLVLRLENGMPS